MRKSTTMLLMILAASGSANLALADSAWSWGNPQPTGAALSAASATDVNTATVVGAGGVILRTTDGGETWNAQSSGVTAYLSAVCFTDANTGTVVGGNGTILHTT